MTPTHSPGPEPRWWWCAVAGEMSATRACDDTEWEHSLCGWQQPAASSPDEGAERPGGWVDGIGWVALLTSLPTGTYYSWFETDTERNWRMVGDPYTVMRLKRYSVHGPAIVRRWADGTTPAPPAPSPCPYIVTGDEGTSHCALAESRPAPVERPQPDEVSPDA